MTREQALALAAEFDRLAAHLRAMFPDPSSAPDEAELRKMMRDSRFWRERDPEFVRRVNDGYRRLCGHKPTTAAIPERTAA